MKETIDIFEIGTLEFAQVKNSHVKPKIPITWVHLGYVR